MPESREEIARVGMWAFLASELLLFSGLIALYASYRALHGADFANAAAYNVGWVGGTNTLILVTSSFTAAAALARPDRMRTFLGATILLGLGFLALKFFEYSVHFREGIYPGAGYRFAGAPTPGARTFFTLYFFMTGLHAMHLVAGCCVLGWIVARPKRIRLQLGVLYWHLVDLVWVFLWPLFYRR